jgi:hypothetical protein
MTEAAEEHQLLTLREAAKLLRCSKAHLCNVLNGRVRNVPPLNSVRLGRRRLINRRSLSAWISAMEGANGLERPIPPSTPLAARMV